MRRGRRGPPQPAQPEAPKVPGVDFIPVDGKYEEMAPLWYFGAAADREGDVFMVPYMDIAMTVVGGRRISGLKGAGGGGCKWLGIALGGNGSLYCVPFNSQSILEIPLPEEKPEKKKKGVSQGIVAPKPPTDFIEDRRIATIDGLSAQMCKWTGAATGMDGNIYCSPYNADSVLCIQTETRDYSLLTGVGPGRSKWAGAATGADGKIYCAPFNAESVLVINPESRELSFLGNLGKGHGKWFGAAATSSGKVVFAPYNEESVLVIDTETQELSQLLQIGEDGDAVGNGSGKWTGAAVGFDDCVYFAPYNANKVLRMNPETMTLSFLDEDIGTGLGKYFGAAAGLDGRIICAPWNAEQILTIRTKEEEKPPERGRRRL